MGRGYTRRDGTQRFVPGDASRSSGRESARPPLSEGWPCGHTEALLDLDAFVHGPEKHWASAQREEAWRSVGGAGGYVSRVQTVSGSSNSNPACRARASSAPRS